jgi:WD40 repeat protein
VFRWDVRYTAGGPVRKYEVPGEDEGEYDRVYSLAIDPRQRILVGASSGGIVCWNLETGASCLP